jgi:uncharacterized membrane protein (DUF106 family)
MRQFKVYVKLILLVALALVLGLVVFNNRHNTVDVWFFKAYESVNVCWLMLITAIGSIATWWILRATVGVWREMRELAKEAHLEKKRAEQEKLAEKLAETEKRIDSKLKGAIGPDKQ